MFVSLSHLLRILRVFYQGFQLVTRGLKKEIDSLDEEIRANSTSGEQAKEPDL